MMRGPISTYSRLPRPPLELAESSPGPPPSSFEDTAPMANAPLPPRRSGARRVVYARAARAAEKMSPGKGAPAAAASRGRKARATDGTWVAEREEARAEMRTRPPTLEHDNDSKEAATVVIIARLGLCRGGRTLPSMHADLWIKFG